MKDSGLGIPKERQENLFDPFVQADSSTTRRHGGTGLGLAICRRLVELMDGEIGVESTLGEGSLFWFEMSFPVVAEVTKEARAKMSLCGKRVLVVDDNEINRLIMEEAVRYGEGSSVTVESGPQALAAFVEAQEKGRPFDVVLVDYLMPEMDGMEVIERIRSFSHGHGVGIVMLSSSGFPETRTAALEKGAHGFLIKPSSRERVLRALVDALAQKPGVTPGSGKTVRRKIDSSRFSELRVLLVEDNRVNQKVAIKMLERWGCQVTVANHGKEALEILDEASFDLYLVDIQMPIMDGWQFTERVRALEEGTSEHRTLVAMTANAMKEDRERCLRAGMDGYLSKPVRLAALEKVIADVSAEIALVPKA